MWRWHGHLNGGMVTRETKARSAHTGVIRHPWASFCMQWEVMKSLKHGSNSMCMLSLVSRVPLAVKKRKIQTREAEKGLVDLKPQILLYKVNKIVPYLKKSFIQKLTCCY